MSEYTIVSDSHHIMWLKEEGYGFIASRHGLRDDDLRPINKGVEMSPEELEKAWKQALAKLQGT